MSVTFEMAPAVEAIAKSLIDSYHPHLLNKRIEYVFRSRHSKAGRQIVMGKCRLVSGINAFMSTDYGEEVHKNLMGEPDEAPSPFFILEIAKDIWIGLTMEQRKALVDHELCHAGIAGEKLITMQHDVTEFVAVVKRHGLWMPDLAALVKAAGQPVLELEQGGASVDKGAPEVETAAEKPRDPGAAADATGSPSLLEWAASLPMEEQTLPIANKAEKIWVIEVDPDSYKALRDKLGEDDHYCLFLPGTYTDAALRCLAQNVPTGARWPGLDKPATVIPPAVAESKAEKAKKKAAGK